MRAALATVLAIVCAACSAGPDEPIDVGTASATAVCEGNFQDAAQLATPQLVAGRTVHAFGDEVWFRSPCDGEVVEVASQADRGPASATVRVRLELDSGEVTLHEVELVETAAGWHVSELRQYTEGWPPDQSDG